MKTVVTKIVLGGLISGLALCPNTASSMAEAPGAIVRIPSSPSVNFFPRLQPPQTLSTAQYSYLLRQAQAITVKIETPYTQGSGVIISEQAGQYTVITNDHVILDSDRLIIQTSDGRRHVAHQNQRVNVGNADLALVEFQSANIHYPVATLAPGLTLNHGSLVFSAGFPSDIELQEGDGLKLTHGKISQIIDQGLNGGYQIGYSNWVPKGMSGGPVLNQQGQVIAINGLHAEPLWGNPYIWDDGTIPSPKLFPMFANSSWAIPAERVLDLLPQQS